MICLTGDVHHDGLRTNEQLFLLSRCVESSEGRAAQPVRPKRTAGQGCPALPNERIAGNPIKKFSEVAVTSDYVRLCEKYKVKCTLYVTGRTLADQWETFQPVANSPLVEIGGHTYAGLPAGYWEILKARLTGKAVCSHASSPGSFASQQRDTKRMMEVAGRRLGKPIVSWRSHGLVCDRHTYGILANAGIRFVSDDLNWRKLFPERLPEGLISHPMNVIMDHDHLFHAHRTPAYVARQQRPFPDDPASGSYTIEDWGALVEKQVLAIEKKDGVATVLLHPLCMFAADGFKTMERLLKQFARFQTIWASETEQYVK